MLNPFRPIVRAGAFILVAVVALGGFASVAGATVWSPGDDAVDEASGSPVAVAVVGADGSWSVDSAGVVVANGTAPHFGDLEGIHLEAPVIDIVGTPTGSGYLLAAEDGGVFAFGDARFEGSAAPYGPVSPIVGISLTAGGYWLTGSDGGVFSFGEAGFFGSGAQFELKAPIVDIASSGSGNGYLLLGADGGVLTFGDAEFAGSLVGTIDAVAVSIAQVDGGYRVLTESGNLAALGDMEAVESPEAADGVVATGLSVSSEGDIAISFSTGHPGLQSLTPGEAFVAGLSAERIATWEALAECESNGRWDINTGNGYYGGIQFAPTSWWAVGGEGYPHNAAREEQIYRGELLLDMQGWGAWPGCTRKLGLR